MSGGSEDDSLAAALGRIPSGLFVLTVRHGKKETGMLASWVQQCSFNPPQLTAALRKERDILTWLTEGSAFTVNVIPEGGKALVAHFGKGFEVDQPAFDGLEVRRNDETPPVLLASHAYLVCRVTWQLDVGDHILVVGRVVAGGVLHPGHPTVHVRKNGMKY
jgi:flavin reductase (DIM6/NTAB) family NADH-FMN oxidoreductase RutF